ncbi:MAG: 4-hydroxy-tetrahydrodipicolinate synthase [Ignavibacteria bacterium]|nr:4-hydroxy-tetrahydrodipicolinate synthase [Ignavibacteria bacterium]
MKNIELRGTITAIVTPFLSDTTIDFEALKTLLEFQISSGVEGIVISGSTGEGATLSAKEKMSLIVQTVEYCSPNIQVIMGAGTNSTQASIDMTLVAKEYGADAVLLVAPYYNKPNQQGLFEHFRAIAEAVDIPQILYNVPGRTGVNMTAETQQKLAETCQNIIGTKEASGDLEQMMEIIKYAPEHFKLYSGDDSLALPVVFMGGAGVISVLSNYAPKKFSDCIRAALAGHYHQAKELHYELLDLMQINFIETNPIPVKAALAMMGMLEEVYRLPLVPARSESKEKIRQALLKAGIIS